MIFSATDLLISFLFWNLYRSNFFSSGLKVVSINKIVKCQLKYEHRNHLTSEFVRNKHSILIIRALRSQIFDLIDSMAHSFNDMNLNLETTAPTPIISPKYVRRSINKSTEINIVIQHIYIQIENLIRLNGITNGKEVHKNVSFCFHSLKNLKFICILISTKKPQQEIYGGEVRLTNKTMY